MRGFSLIELMISMVIVAILAAIAYPSYQQYIERTKRADAMAELEAIGNRLEQYKIDNNRSYLGADALIPDMLPENEFSTPVYQRSDIGACQNVIESTAISLCYVATDTRFRENPEWLYYARNRTVPTGLQFKQTPGVDIASMLNNRTHRFWKPRLEAYAFACWDSSCR